MEGLAAMSERALEMLADRVLADARIAVVAGPQVGVAPLRLPAPAGGGSTVVGRVVLTTCEVAVEGCRGDGVVSGRRPRAALAVAICDAECERRGAGATEVERSARRALDAERTKRAVEGASIARTRVVPE